MHLKVKICFLNPCIVDCILLQLLCIPLEPSFNVAHVIHTFKQPIMQLQDKRLCTQNHRIRIFRKKNKQKQNIYPKVIANQSLSIGSTCSPSTTNGDLLHARFVGHLQQTRVVRTTKGTQGKVNLCIMPLTGKRSSPYLHNTKKSKGCT